MMKLEKRPAAHRDYQRECALVELARDYPTIDNLKADLEVDPLTIRLMNDLGLGIDGRVCVDCIPDGRLVTMALWKLSYFINTTDGEYVGRKIIDHSPPHFGEWAPRYYFEGMRYCIFPAKEQRTQKELAIENPPK